MTLPTWPWRAPGRRPIVLLFLLSLLATTPALARTAAQTPSDDSSPWGMAAGAGSLADYPRFTPILNEAGVRWLRIFPEWQTIEPKPGQWNWQLSDQLVANARASNLHILGLWYYFAPWASADGDTRRGPIKDMQYWRDYVSSTVSRYHKDIKYWEVWNEFDGSFYEGRQGADRARDYADLVVAAYDAAKKIDPDVKVGTCVGAGFLDLAIKVGASNHFDFVAVHPYSNLQTMGEGSVAGYLGLVTNLRRMLVANKQRADIPIWITEIGQTAPVKAESSRDALQAEMLVKGYILALAQGFEHIFWFETRGDSEDGGISDFGIIRPDWTPRPSYRALKTMTTLLGKQPEYLGWPNLGTGGYGFLFRGQRKPVLAAWAPAGKPELTTFPSTVRITNLAGKESPLAVRENLSLTTTPIFVTQITDDLAIQARTNRARPFPWGGDYARVEYGHLHSWLHQHRRRVVAGSYRHNHSCEQRQWPGGRLAQNRFQSPRYGRPLPVLHGRSSICTVRDQEIDDHHRGQTPLSRQTGGYAALLRVGIQRPHDGRGLDHPRR